MYNTFLGTRFYCWSILDNLTRFGEANRGSILSGYMWKTDDETLEAVAGKMLAEKSQNLAIMESCPGDSLAPTLPTFLEAWHSLRESWLPIPMSSNSLRRCLGLSS